jgi:hypothetical protein
MTTSLNCYNCGADLSGLSLPISRRDMCPGCSVHLHACRMCTNFDANVIGQCREEDAEEVLDKRRVNFCEWFTPSPRAWDPDSASGDAAARAQLDALFGDGPADSNGGPGDDALDAAEKLFD